MTPAPPLPRPMHRGAKQSSSRPHAWSLIRMTAVPGLLFSGEQEPLAASPERTIWASLTGLSRRGDYGAIETLGRDRLWEEQGYRLAALTMPWQLLLNLLDGFDKSEVGLACVGHVILGRVQQI
jgi:hypothetical protein